MKTNLYIDNKRGKSIPISPMFPTKSLENAYNQTSVLIKTHQDARGEYFSHIHADYKESTIMSLRRTDDGKGKWHEMIDGVALEHTVGDFCTETLEEIYQLAQDELFAEIANGGRFNEEQNK